MTAQRRSEPLQRVPMSVTALSSEHLTQLKLVTPSDLAAQIPNMQVNSINGEGSPLFALRGVSMFDYSLNQLSPVATYVDGAYKGSILLLGVELYDLDSVEVLRGPQGTLYGKNTTGGAINIISTPPDFNTTASIRLGFGNYNRREAEGAVQAALNDQLAVRVAFTHAEADGFVKNILLGQSDMQGIDQFGVRVSALYQVRDDLDLTLRYSRSRQNPVNYANISENIATGPPYGPGIGGTGYFRTVDGLQDSKPLTAHQVASDLAVRRRQDNEAAALTANLTLPSGIVLTSISSWDQGSLYLPEHTDGAPLSVLRATYTGDTDQLTQDLKLASSTDGSFEFIVGTYYQRDEMHVTNENKIFNFLDLNGDDVLDYIDCVDASFGPEDVGIGYASGVVINPACRYYNSFEQTRSSWAIYTDASYQVTSSVKVRAGLRYTDDNLKQDDAVNQLRGSDGVPIANLGFFSMLPNGFEGPTLALPGSPGYEELIWASRRQDLKSTDVTGRFGIDLTPTDDSLLYLAYNRGYRSAAFNAQFLFTPDDFTSVKPETLDSFEFGFKTRWFANRLQFNGAAFHYRYSNQQTIDIRPSGAQPLINLGRSRIDGAELEVVAQPTSSLLLRAGLGLLDAKIEVGAIADGTVDVSGNVLPYAPSVSGMVGLDWDALESDKHVLSVHLESTYTSKQYFDLSNFDQIAQKAYGIVDARLALRSRDDRWSVGVWSKNLADKRYYTFGGSLTELGFDNRRVGAPRTYGVDASYRL